MHCICCSSAVRLMSAAGAMLSPAVATRQIVPMTCTRTKPPNNFWPCLWVTTISFPTCVQCSAICTAIWLPAVGVHSRLAAPSSAALRCAAAAQAFQLLQSSLQILVQQLKQPLLRRCPRANLTWPLLQGGNYEICFLLPPHWKHRNLPHPLSLLLRATSGHPHASITASCQLRSLPAWSPPSQDSRAPACRHLVSAAVSEPAFTDRGSDPAMPWVSEGPVIDCWSTASTTDQVPHDRFSGLIRSDPASAGLAGARVQSARRTAFKAVRTTTVAA